MAGRSVLSAILFYFLYNERLRMKHIIGIMLLLGCVTLISFGVDKSIDDTESAANDINYSYVMAWIVGLSMINCFIYTLSGILARVSHNRGFTQLQYSADGMIVFSIIYFVLMVQENSRIPYSFEEVWPVGFGSYLMVFSVILTNCAIAYGKAGPS
jgi:drug/metabolite transporter (DMT)-like permease